MNMIDKSKATLFLLITILILTGYCQGSSLHHDGQISTETPAGSLHDMNPPVGRNSTFPSQLSLQVLPQTAKERIIVRYKTDVIKPGPVLTEVMNSMNQKVGSSVITDFSPMGIPGMQIIRPDNRTIEDTIRQYTNNSLVLYAEPDHVIALSPSEQPESVNNYSISSKNTQSTNPNDPDYSLLWGLYNTGQAPFYGTAGSDISAADAWSTTTGSSSVIVAVVDTGVDYTHEDLSSNIWTNSGEIAGNNKDDDGNGYVDDIRGWNFVDDSNDPMDDNGHGTHCAGTIAAVGNNNIGVTGVCWHAQIMPLKFLDSSGSGYTSDAISAILYADQKGAHIFSNSWGGTEYSRALKEAIDASSAVVVCAAGNEEENSDISPVYPAAYTSSNIISVAATGYTDNLASFSNYGATSVDIAAPGVKILSTYPENTYAYLSGTSMATPHVAGVAGLILAKNSELASSQVKSQILESADVLTGLSGKMVSGGRLNAAGAVRSSSNTNVTSPNSTEAGGSSGLQASFTAAPRQGKAPLIVQFLESSSGGKNSWRWKFGDGEVSFVRNPRHIYQNSGTYQVTLTVSDGNNSSTGIKTGFITVR
ncbi:MAG: S8 family serine peptidase [Methanobacteriota archaeon]